MNTDKEQNNIKSRRYINESEAELLINNKIESSARRIASEFAKIVENYKLGCCASNLFRTDIAAEEYRMLKNTVDIHISEHKKIMTIFWIIFSTFGVTFFGLLMKIILQISNIQNMQIITK